jgi:protein-tyrosine phosphatase
MPYVNIMKHFSGAIQFMKTAISSGGTVLVHCFAGISRSASCVIAYLMHENNVPFFEAMSYVRKRRHIVFPNFGFQRQLMDFERQLKTRNRNNSENNRKQSSNSISQKKSDYYSLK